MSHLGVVSDIGPTARLTGQSLPEVCPGLRFDLPAGGF